MKVDRNTLNVERGRFARICVEIDLTQPVIGKVWVNGHWYKVQYEGLHIICSSCGCYGHYTRNCVQGVQLGQLNQQPTMSTIQPSPTSMNKPTKEVMQTRVEVGDHPTTEEEGDANTMENQKEALSNNREKEDATMEMHGDWLVVTRKKRNGGTHNIGGKRGQVADMRNKGKTPAKDVNYEQHVQGTMVNGNTKKWVKAKKRRFEIWTKYD